MMKVTAFLTTIIAASGVSFGASAIPIDPFVTYGSTGVGAYSVDTGNITSSTATKTIPTTELVSGPSGDLGPFTCSIIGGCTAVQLAGLVNGAPVIFSQYTFSTLNPAVLVPFTVTAGNLIVTFTGGSTTIVPTGVTTNGSISQQYSGTVTGLIASPTEPNASLFLGQTATLSETCTQTGLAAAITCSESVRTPGLPPTGVPEPSSLALLCAGILGLLGFKRLAANSAKARENVLSLGTALRRS